MFIFKSGQRNGITLPQKIVAHPQEGIAYVRNLIIQAKTGIGFGAFENQLVVVDDGQGHRRYEIDFEDFEKKIVENDVKLFILCSVLRFRPDGIGIFVLPRFVLCVSAPCRPAENIHPKKDIEKPDTKRDPEPFDRPVKEEMT